jgi:GNAT superfamily N-acetyltransferase
MINYTRSPMRRYLVSTLPSVNRLPLPVQGDVVEVGSESWRLNTVQDATTERLDSLLKHGHTGLAVLRDGKWIAYGCVARPGGTPPPHLPAAATGAGRAWIFGCRTREDLRGKGIYGWLLSELNTISLSRGSNAVYVDTTADNGPARAAVAKVGGAESGIYYVATVPVGLGRRTHFGWWDRYAMHPETKTRGGS